jgi:5-methyltetrahydropteroyltriglutamate--homocysteine methyltransferase
MENRFYKSDEEHLFAVAGAMHEEYSSIVNSGFMVQVDDPRLAMHHMLTPGDTVEQARAWARRRIEALNHALRGIPSDRVRHHTCYGINAGAANRRERHSTYPIAIHQGADGAGHSTLTYARAV